MKHMKRALSLVLAMVMLLGMMVIPTGAVSNFADADEVTYTEEVAITSGIGLFAGSGGKFLPKDTVTRATMATIIVKMLFGSKADANSFKGINGGFTDIASFEGGWAEGYINWCASLGVVAGYGDGTFRPGQAVTTAEAATMILNALQIDAGAGSWPFTVMSKAEELKFFQDLSPKPDTNKALTREELAVIAFHGLEYSPEGKMGYVYNGVVYDDYMAAYLAANRDASKVDPAKKDSLAADVFGLKSVTGFVTGNQATGLDYTEVKVAINGASNTYKFAIETDQTAIGHYVTVYYDEQYKNEKEPGTTYTIFDETTVVEVTEDIDSRTDFRAAFGSGTVKLSTVEACVVESDYTVKAGYPKATGGFVVNDVTFVTGNTYNVPAGTYILDGNTIVSYIAPAAVYASVVDSVDSYEGEETITLRGVNDPIPNNEGDDMIDEYAAMKAQDYVTYTKVGSRYVLERVRVVSGKVSSTSKTKINGVDYDTITVDGVDYVDFNGNRAPNLNLETSVSNLNYTDTYDFYVTRDGKFIGYKTSDGGINLDNIAYLMGVIKTAKKDSYGDQVITYSARGVDMDGVETLVPLALVKDADGDGNYDNGEELVGGKDAQGNLEAYISDPSTFTKGFYTVKDHTDKDARKEDLKMLDDFSDTYDKETDPVFVARYGMTKEKTPNLPFGGTGTYLIDGNNNNATEYIPIQSSTRCLIVEGTLSQSTPLQAKMTTGSVSVILDESHGYDYEDGDGANNNPKALLSKTSGGAYVLEAIVVPVTSVTDSTASKKIYVSKDKCEYAGVTSDGYVYDVYDAATGKAMQITLEEEAVDLERGFYKVAQDAETKLYHFVTNVGDKTGKIPSPLTENSDLGKNGDVTDGKDGVINANVLYDAPFDGMSNGRMYASFLEYRDASSAVIVDTRRDSEVNASRVSRITSLDRIVSLKSSDEDLYIVMDIWFNSSTGKVTAIYITDVKKSVEITDVTGVDVVLRGDYTLPEVEKRLAAKDSKVMGAITTTHEGKTGLYVNSLEENLRKVTLNDDDIIYVEESAAVEDGYVEATIVSTTNSAAFDGWHCMVRVDSSADITSAGNYCIIDDNGSIKLTKGETVPKNDLNDLGDLDVLKVPDTLYYDEDYIRENIDKDFFVVKADTITFEGAEASIVNVTAAYYTVPKDVLLYSVEKAMAKGTSSGEFIVVNANGSGLTVGETCYFAYDGTNFNQTDTTVYCYGYAEGKLCGSTAMGIGKGGSIYNDYWNGSAFGAVGSALYNGRLGYHRQVTGVTQSGSTYTMAQAMYHPKGGSVSASSSYHNVLGNCENVNNVHTWLQKVPPDNTFIVNPDYADVQNSLNITNAVIVDARNVEDSAKIDSAADLKAAFDAGTGLVVDYIANGMYNATDGTATIIDYIVVVDTSKISK